MTDHHGFIVEVKNLRPHSNADRLQIATFLVMILAFRLM